MDIRNLQDIEMIEATPLEQRFVGKTGYEWLLETASRLPEQVAITALEAGDPLGSGREVTFAELVDNVNKTANMLQSRGLAQDESVTHFLPLVPEAFFVKIAAETVAIINPINPMLEAEHIVDITRSARTRILILPGPDMDKELFEKGLSIAAANQDIHSIYVLGGGEECDGDRILPLESSISEHDGAAIAVSSPKSANDIVAYFHTGGTTGLPKLAQHTQHMRVAQTVTTGMLINYNEQDCVAVGLPMFHVAGSIINGLIPLYRGARLLLLSPGGFRDKDVIAQFWKLVERHGVTTSVVVPTVLSTLLSSPVDGADLSSLRSIVAGGAGVPTQLLSATKELIGLEVSQGFGMTELAGIGMLQINPAPEDRGSSGIRGPYVEVKIATQQSDGSLFGEAATNQIGTLCIKGPCVMPGYAGGRAQAETFTDDGWFNTGDLARMDADGNVWITGRSKDLIIRGGHNIDAMIIEEALHAHPAVQLAAAVGKPDEYAGELPVAYVQLKLGCAADADELAAFAKQRIVERAAAPTEIILVQEIPKTGIDKVFKPALRFDAIRRKFEDELATNPQIDVEASVRVDNDPLAGTLATVLLCGIKSEEQEELVMSSLKRFTTPVTVQWEAEKSPSLS